MAACPCREILSPLSLCYHLIDNFRYSLFIFFFCILFIEDTVLFIFQSYTAKTIGATMTHLTISDISRSSTKRRKTYFPTEVGSYSFITSSLRTGDSYVHRVFSIRREEKVPTVLTVFHIKATMHLRTIKEIVATTPISIDKVSI